ncbi:putative peroxidase [Medicago truncatula]|uniref:Peroxidase n=1 Tax=Medicago truncatula TaxID=3880 RepID=A0A072UYJ4_MEDTR|nr:peroxidase P7 [Medicago truncatula]KEH34511.1 peroxidase family protein [Medicago truncatula]RHN67910.1 putative peroxidase [Medicago truncatula]
MAFHHIQYYFIVLLMATFLTTHSNAELTPDFYNDVCPQALSIINTIVRQKLDFKPRMGAHLLRLHFHDCFVNGCDGSVLLDDTPNFIGEKTAKGNIDSLKGFMLVDIIKAELDKACKGPVVSCADILAVIARDSVSILGGPSYWYQVLLGRRDARNASMKDAESYLPSQLFNLSQLVSNFESQGLNLKDLVALSGAHTIGMAKCSTFRERIYNDTNIDPDFATCLQDNCPLHGGDDNFEALDFLTPQVFDNSYYKNLVSKIGLFHSDQELFKGDGSESDMLVELYSRDSDAFARDFKASMIKMGNIKPLTGNFGEIRTYCGKVN